MDINWDSSVNWDGSNGKTKVRKRLQRRSIRRVRNIGGFEQRWMVSEE